MVAQCQPVYPSIVKADAGVVRVDLGKIVKFCHKLSGVDYLKQRVKHSYGLGLIHSVLFFQ